ncbi:MAG: thioredoxin domain-containing protein [Acidobacteria bacterium]|nr:thioredoxin domain-containing protein [Acidobacteriota bacterium]MBI3425143.1 thioredoxin domain-containing protein [Acidobacteriota bacterium]
MSELSAAPRHTNRLIHETSPYLLQHAHNPVDWYPWGAEALAKAKAENKPLLVSIGYSACHWCHVMEHESFENEAIAKVMNDHFVNIKIDREERPDLDTIYMNAVQMMGQRGGWPLTVFLTPDCVPFYGGTYFPPVDRHGLPGFPRLLLGIADAFQNRRAEVEQSASGLLSELQRINEVIPADGALTTAVLEQAAQQIMRAFDPVEGGFGRAPKFPPSMTLSFLLRQSQRTSAPALLAAVELTLDKMARGGMYDQLGGGFHRYSVDEKWLVPHFEKMLYDNALLARIYLDAYLVTGNEFYQQVATETLDYVRREMTDASGGFYSSQDADSEGEEGKFFVWTPPEVEALLGAEDAKLFKRYFDVSAAGNFEGHNILHVDESVETIAKLLNVTPERLQEALTRGKQLLFEAREQRIKPGRDEKMLTAWNGLMLRSFAEAAQVLSRADYLETAVRNAEFVLTTLKHDGRLWRTHKDGISKLNAYQEDYAYLIDGLLALYEASFDTRWFVEARALADTMIGQFWDAENGGFYFTSADHEALISRTKDFYDNATPAGNSIAAHVLLRLALFTGEARYRELAEQILQLTSHDVQRMPNGFGHMLCAHDLYLAEAREIALVGSWSDPATAELIAAIFQRYLPNKVVALAAPEDATAGQTIPLLAQRGPVGGKATAYVCRNFICAAPVTAMAELEALLQ